jgi:hypothetical protein
MGEGEDGRLEDTVELLAEGVVLRGLAGGVGLEGACVHERVQGDLAAAVSGTEVVFAGVGCNTQEPGTEVA